VASFNKVILVGNLTRDVELRQTQGGSAVCEIGLAVNRSWFNKQTQQREEDVTFVDVTLWGRTAEVAGQYLAKGRSVLIEGRLQLDQWDDRETGQKRSKLKVVGENMTMLGSGNSGNGGGQQPQQNQQYSQQQPFNDGSGFDQPAGTQGWQPDLDNVPF